MNGVNMNSNTAKKAFKPSKGLILAGVQYVVVNWKTMGLNAEIIMAGLAVVLGVVILVRLNATTMPFVLAGIGMIYAAVCGVVNELRK